MKKTAKDIYTDTATHALAGFQLLEASLKDYIAEYYHAIKTMVGTKLPFKYDRADIENSPLGRLCTLFSKLNENEPLIKKIQSIQSHRDKLAHRALALTFDRNISDEEYLKMTHTFEETINDIEIVLKEVREERIKVQIVVQL